MSALTALAVWALVLVLGAPPRQVARLRQLTVGGAADRQERESVTMPREKGIDRREPAASSRAPAALPGLLAAPTGRIEEVDAAIVLDLLAVSLKMGSPIPDALAAVGQAIDGQRGIYLRRVSAHLMLGTDWDSAWHANEPELVKAAGALAAAKAALAPAWLNGAPVATLLEHAKRRVRQQQLARDRVAAKKLSVKLIMPVTFCYLPAFVAIGLVPVVLVLVQQGISLL